MLCCKWPSPPPEEGRRRWGTAMRGVFRSFCAPAEVDVVCNFCSENSLKSLSRLFAEQNLWFIQINLNDTNISQVSTILITINMYIVKCHLLTTHSCLQESCFMSRKDKASWGIAMNLRCLLSVQRNYAACQEWLFQLLWLFIFNPRCKPRYEDWCYKSLLMQGVALALVWLLSWVNKHLLD